MGGTSAQILTPPQHFEPCVWGWEGPWGGQGTAGLGSWVPQHFYLKMISTLY